MKTLSSKQILALGLLSALAVAVACNGVGAAPPDVPRDTGSPPFSQNGPVEISKGTPIYVRLQQTISSATAQTGQDFSAVLDEPLAVNGRTIAPEGAGLNLPNEPGAVAYLPAELAGERRSVLARERERLVFERIAQLCDVAKIHDFLKRRRAGDLRALKDDRVRRAHGRHRH